MRITSLKSFILFVSIPLINSIAFSLGTLVHEMHQSVISVEQYNDYQTSMILLISMVGISILCIEFMHDYFIKEDKLTTLLYLTSFCLLAFATRDQFIFRPYEHSLTFLSIGSVMLSRLWLNQRFKSITLFRSAA